MTEAKTDALDACPQCGSTDRNIRQILRHPTEDARCFNPWHDSPKPGAPTGGFVSDQVYPGPSCARCGAEMAYHCNACEEATEAERTNMPLPDANQILEQADKKIKERVKFAFRGLAPLGYFVARDCYGMGIKDALKAIEDVRKRPENGDRGRA